MGRDTPLPRDSVAEQWLRSLEPEPQPYQSPLAVVEFDGGQVVVESRDRGPKSFDPKRLDDPVRQRQQLLAESLGPEFQFIRAVSFANRGEMP